MSGTHEITVQIMDGEARVVLLCHAVPDAPCRRRPPNWETSDAEGWNDDEATVSGFKCWAVEYVEDGGLEFLMYTDPRKEFTYAGPVDVWFEDDCVTWAETAQDEPLPIEVAS